MTILRPSIIAFAWIAALAWAPATARTADDFNAAKDPAKLTAVLRSPDATVLQKAQVCERLAAIGTKDSVSALARLLSDEKLAHYARYGLEPIPDPSVDDALREAMGKLQGNLLVGVIQSIGHRRDAKAIMALAKLLESTDTDVAVAAAGAIGEIGGLQAAKMLTQALPRKPAELTQNQGPFAFFWSWRPSEPPAVRTAVGAGCLVCAEGLAAQGKPMEAGQLYAAMRKADLPPEQLAAAVRGTIVLGQPEGRALLVEQLQAKDRALFHAALGAARELHADAAVPLLAAQLDKLPPDRSALVVLAIGDLGGPTAVASLRQAAKGENYDVRLASLLALMKMGTIGGPEAIDQLVASLLNAKTSEQGATATAAIKSACERTADRDETAEKLAGVMSQASVMVKVRLQEALAACGGPRALAAVGAVARGADPECCDAASRLLGQWMTPDAAPILLDLACSASSDKLRTRALRGYIRIARQLELPLAERLQMAHAAIREASRDEERLLAVDLLKRLAGPSATKELFTPLLDAKTFAGWEGNRQVFRIENGCVVGGSLKKPLAHNEFLCTTKEFGDFELTLKCKLLGTRANGGIQIRSRRIPNHHEMSGYQADMGEAWELPIWGCLYDESRRNRILAGLPPDQRAKFVKLEDWNDYLIRCKGPHIQLWLNGQKTVDYTEPDPSISQKGFIGLQIHGGGPSEAWYKDLAIRPLAANE